MFLLKKSTKKHQTMYSLLKMPYNRLIATGILLLSIIGMSMLILKKYQIPKITDNLGPYDIHSYISNDPGLNDLAEGVMSLYSIEELVSHSTIKPINLREEIEDYSDPSKNLFLLNEKASPFFNFETVTMKLGTHATPSLNEGLDRNVDHTDNGIKLPLSATVFIDKDNNEFSNLKYHHNSLVIGGSYTPHTGYFTKDIPIQIKDFVSYNGVSDISLGNLDTDLFLFWKEHPLIDSLEKKRVNENIREIIKLKLSLGTM